MKRTLAGGLAIVLSAVALVGLDSVGASAGPVPTTPVVSTDSHTVAGKLKPPKVTVTKVTATSSATTSGTNVRTTVRVKNNASVRKPALLVRLYLTDGDTRLKLGDVRVKSLASGGSVTLSATRTASLKAPAGQYSVVACRGPWATQNCRTSAATVTIEPARLVPSPAALSFGDVPIGSTSAPSLVTITNRGPATTGTLTTDLGTNSTRRAISGFSIVGSTCHDSLAPRASCTVSVTVSPDFTGTLTGFLAVQGTRAAPISVALSARGIDAALSIDASTYDFGYTDNPAEHVFTVTNDGDATSGEPVVEVQGSSAFDVTTDTCTTALDGGDSCTVGVTYTGSGSEEQSADLSVATEPGGTVTAELSGFPLALTVDPTTSDFGGILVGETSDAESYTLTNHRLTSVEVDGEDVTGPFALDTSCSEALLPAGGTCTFSAHFAPTSEGSASGHVEYSAGSGSATVELSGTGETPAAFSASPSTLDFGAYAPGDTGTQQVTVTNTGTQASSTVDYSFTGTNAADFAVGNSTCPATLPGGASCVVTVAFAPSALGDKTAALAVAGAPGGTAALTALAAPAGVTLYPVTHDYGSVAVGSAGYFTFRVVNTTNNAEDMNSASSGPPFPLELGQDFTCVIIISTIQPHRWCTMTLSFKPQSVGSFSTTLTAGGTNFNTQSQLSGTGVPPSAPARRSSKAAPNSTHQPTSVRLSDGKSVVGYE